MSHFTTGVGMLKSCKDGCVVQQKRILCAIAPLKDLIAPFNCHKSEVDTCLVVYEFRKPQMSCLGHIEGTTRFASLTLTLRSDVGLH